MPRAACEGELTATLNPSRHHLHFLCHPGGTLGTTCVCMAGKRIILARSVACKCQTNDLCAEALTAIAAAATAGAALPAGMAAAEPQRGARSCRDSLYWRMHHNHRRRPPEFSPPPGVTLTASGAYHTENTGNMMKIPARATHRKQCEAGVPPQ